MPFTDDNYFVIDDPQQVGAMWNYHYNDDTHLTIGPDGSGMSLSREPNITVWNRPFAGSICAIAKAARFGAQPGHPWARIWMPMNVATAPRIR